MKRLGMAQFVDNASHIYQVADSAGTTPRGWRRTWKSAPSVVIVKTPVYQW